MPMRAKKTAGGTAYGSPIVGAVQDTLHVKLDVSTMTTAEVDSKGFLKPGLPLTIDGLKIGASPAFVSGVVLEPIKIVDENPTDVTLAADTSDPLIALGVGLCNRDVIEDNLGRVLTANEIAGFTRAGSQCSLTLT